MKKLLVPVCLSALAAAFAADASKSVAADSVSVGRDGVSARGGGASVSAGRGGVSARGGGASVSASRDGVSARGGGATATASRDGASARSGGASVTSADDGSTGSVNARGDREYDSLGSWMEDLGRWWSGDESETDRTVSSSRSTSKDSSAEQVSEAEATSSDGDPAVAEARNSKVTTQN